MSGSALRGLAFPPIPDPGLSTLTGPERAAQAIRTLLHTEPGERIGRPEFGVGLRRFVYSPNDPVTRTSIERAIIAAVRRDVPGVALDGVLVTPHPGEPTRIDIEIRYYLPDDPTPLGVSSVLALAGATPAGG